MTSCSFSCRRDPFQKQQVNSKTPRGAKILLLELISIEKGSKNENGRVASHESVLSHFKHEITPHIRQNKHLPYFFGYKTEFFPSKTIPKI